MSLPKGGGAIRGIGEEFTVNTATGTASLSIPLPASPGRGGQGPQVALSYSSGAGNGPFGLGFQLSVPTISRKTDKGLPRYVDSAETDTYVFSESEDLVPVLDESGQHVRIDRGTHWGYRYRPRIEGLFARIERWVDKGTKDVHWRVTTKDNVTHVYGTTSATRVHKPGDESQTFTWLLEETRDDKGNVTRYEYKGENGANVNPKQVSERSRFDYSASPPQFRATAQRYLKRVLYGNAVPDVPGDFLFEMVFDYGDHEDLEDPVGQEEGWPVRPDAFSMYRPGFEVRTYRLCQRVLMFHRLSATRDPLLVRATEFDYDDGPAFTYLRGVTQVGYLRNPDTSVLEPKAMPTLSLDYQKPVLKDELETVPEQSLAGLVGGTDGARKQWVDLDGEGIPGVLIDQGGGWFYKENWGAGDLKAPRAIQEQPVPSNVAGGVQKLEDLDGDGRLELVSLRRSLSGYFERTDTGGFEPLRTFESLPHIDWNDPNLRYIDLDGDGRADLLITEDHALVWYRSRAKQGFEESKRVPMSFDEREGPLVVFSDPEQSIQLADMSGDGLVDIVRVRNGEVCYWPNLGYGRFGAKVTLSNGPTFDTPDHFHASRVRFGDVDGSGTSDLFYLGRRGVTLYLNESGNALSDAVRIRSVPPVDSAAQVSIADLLGTGTSCLVWSTPLQHPAKTLFYVDLMDSKKPHLLTEVKNNLGATTTITYASSTKYYLEDKKAGVRWLTRLPFPVQVVERMERSDAISGGKLVSRYRYRHGYYDGAEREFRGFARVDQWDAEDFAEEGTDPLLYQPPVHTISWYHTGAWLEKTRLEIALQEEYFDLGPPELLLEDTILPGNLSVQDEREAARALKGSMLRQEVYGEDGSEKAGLPFVVTEQNQEVRLIQRARGEDRYGIFFAFPRETVTITAERKVTDPETPKIEDPRVGHEFILDVDEFGNVTRQAAVAYARAHAELTAQGRAYVTLTETRFVNQAEEAGFYRVGTEIEQKLFEVGALDLPKAGEGLLTLDALRSALDALDPANDLPFEAEVDALIVQRRLLEHRQQTFYTDDLTGEAPFEDVGIRALPFQTYQLALTTGQVGDIVTESGPGHLNGVVLDPAILTDKKLGGYVQRPGGYWAPGGRVVFEPTQFYLPVAAFDPFMEATDPHFTVTYDDFNLLVTETTDPLGNTVAVENDYRVLAPSLITDPNLNQTWAGFDALGMVVATAVMGKDATEGDSPEDPTVQFEYGLLSFQEDGEPTFVRTLAREEHQDPNTRWQESYTYSDGFGRVVMEKVQAEPGEAPKRDENGELVFEDDELQFEHTDHRWVGTGRTVFNNKGNPVKQYEPFFSGTHEFETEDDLVEWGVTPIIKYDSLDRVVRTDFPDRTFSKVEFDSWRQEEWDQNDTVLDSGWYAERNSPPPTGPEPSIPQERAAWLAAQHAGTPTLTDLDTLGRPVRTVANNRIDGVDIFYETKMELDIEGNTLAIYDARQIKRDALTPLPTIVQCFDVLGRRLRIDSADAGARLTVADAAGKPLRSWDSRGQTMHASYDALQRPTHRYVDDGSSELLVHRVSYGESLDTSGPSNDPSAPSTAQGRNLRGRVHLAFDSAGLVKTGSLDFKGNVLSASRRLATVYQSTVNWGALATIEDPDLLESTAALEAETFTTETVYDALNRVRQSVTPDGSVSVPSYNEANLLESVSVSVRGGAANVVVENIDYNARGQRLSSSYAATSGTPSHATTYTYDPKTFRVVRILTVRDSDGAKLQDLNYTYDAVGNITEKRDHSNWEEDLSGALGGGGGRYVYDAIYRMVEATGREHSGQQPTHEGPPHGSVPHGNDLSALRAYVEKVAYDAVGNITEVRHLAGPSNTASWSRRYDYFEESNRLRATSVADDEPEEFSAIYTYDAHGSMSSMPHLALLEWDYAGRLQHTVKSNGSNQHTRFTYDASGLRVRKVYEHNGIVEERIYLGALELYRKRSGTIGAPADLERQTLHINDGVRRVAMAETKPLDENNEEPTIALNETRWRYQLDDHLGSSVVEVNELAEVISYEEYHPYGSTALHTAKTGEVSPKRYRYTGKEKDSETGLYYHGARYYAPWLGRWTAADPLGVAAPGTPDLNLYAYVEGNPISFSDPNGTDKEDERLFFGRTAEFRRRAQKGQLPRRPTKPAKDPTPPPAEKGVTGGTGQGSGPNGPLTATSSAGGGGETAQSQAGTGAPGAGTAGSGTSSGGDVGGATGSDGGSPAGTGESGGSEGGTGRGDEGTGTGGDLTASQELAKAAAVVAPGEEEEDGSEHGNVGGSAEKGSLLDNPAGQALIAGALIADFVTTVASLGKLVGKFLAKGVAKGVSFLAGKIAQGFTAAKEAVGSAASAIGGFFKKLFGKETARDAPKLLPAPRMVRHHIFNKFRGRSPASQKYRDFFKKHGIEVDKWTVEIPEAMHKEWIHGAGRNWTTAWKRWIDANPSATTKQVYQQAGRMMDEYGLSGRSLVPYR